MIVETRMNYALKIYQENGHGRELVFFGIQSEMKSWFKNKGVCCEKIFSRSTQNECLPASALAQMKDRYFVFCAYRSNLNENFFTRMWL